MTEPVKGKLRITNSDLPFSSPIWVEGLWFIHVSCASYLAQRSRHYLGGLPLWMRDTAIALTSVTSWLDIEHTSAIAANTDASHLVAAREIQ